MIAKTSHAKFTRFAIVPTPSAPAVSPFFLFQARRELACIDGLRTKAHRNLCAQRPPLQHFHEARNAASQYKNLLMPYGVEYTRMYREVKVTFSWISYFL
jgi:hypothetical protein